MRSYQLCVYLPLLLVTPANIWAQEVDGYRLINVTLNTSNPAQLAIDRGRLVWKDTDLNSGSYILKYYSGAEITPLDSNLLGVTAAISGDHIVWNTSGEIVKVFDLQTWTTTLLGQSYNPDFSQPVVVSNELVAFARRKAGSGTHIVLHHIASGRDTLFDEGIWNTAPSLHHAQIAWVAADSEQSTASSNIFFSDGRKTGNISRTNGILNRTPILRDGQIAWLQTGGGNPRVMLFTGDTTLMLVQSQGGAEIVKGYDLSDGIAIAAVMDTVTQIGTIKIFNSETRNTTILIDSSGVSSLHISNGLVTWQSGTGPGKRLKTFSIQNALLQDIAAAENPVVDHDIIAWTLGDAVVMYRPVTFRQLTFDGMNGWEQTKFKTIDSARVVWGNFANSLHMRLFFWDGSTTTQLTDSIAGRDLLMANDGYLIWRSDFDSMYYFDGSHPPVKFLDTVQVENPYVAGGSIGFFGLRLSEKNSIKHAWLYEINNRRLTQLTTDSSNSWNVLCDAKTACWLNVETERLMFYDGTNTTPLSDSAAGSDYSYRNGRIVWTERRSGVWQVMMYDVATKTTTQLTHGTTSTAYPLTDGSHVIWYENPDYPLTSVNTIMWYYDITSARAAKVAHAQYPALYWNWMSNGKIAWTANGNVFVFDGSVISQLTNDDFNLNSGAYLDRGMLVWRRTPPPPATNNGQVYTGRLRPHAVFDALNIAGVVPLTVSFRNRAWEGNLTYRWDFGDGETSTEANPVHTYLREGTSTVGLTVYGPGGSTMERKVNLVRAASSTAVTQGNIAIPQRPELYQNYPNPFNPTTKIQFSIVNSQFTILKVFDVLGREVVTLVNEMKTPGKYAVLWDASSCSSGVYCIRLQAGSRTEIMKALLLR